MQLSSFSVRRSAPLCRERERRWRRRRRRRRAPAAPQPCAESSAWCRPAWSPSPEAGESAPGERCGTGDAPLPSPSLGRSQRPRRRLRRGSEARAAARRVRGKGAPAPSPKRFSGAPGEHGSGEESRADGRASEPPAGAESNAKSKACGREEGEMEAGPRTNAHAFADEEAGHARAAQAREMEVRRRVNFPVIYEVIYRVLSSMRARGGGAACALAASAGRRRARAAAAVGGARRRPKLAPVRPRVSCVE